MWLTATHHLFYSCISWRFPVLNDFQSIPMFLTFHQFHSAEKKNDGNSWIIFDTCIYICPPPPAPELSRRHDSGGTGCSNYNLSQVWSTPAMLFHDLSQERVVSGPNCPRTNCLWYDLSSYTWEKLPAMWHCNNVSQISLWQKCWKTNIDKNTTHATNSIYERRLSLTKIIWDVSMHG